MRDLSERFIILEEPKEDRIRAYDKLLMKFVTLRQIKTNLSTGKIIALLDKIINLNNEFLKIFGYQTLDNGIVYAIEDIPPQEKADLRNNVRELLQVTRYIGRMFEYLNSQGFRIKLPEEDKIYKEDEGKYLVSPLDLVDINMPERVQNKGEILNTLMSFFISFSPQSLRNTLSSLIERNIISKLDSADALVNMLNTFVLQEERMKSRPESKRTVGEPKGERKKISPWVFIITILLVLASISVWLLYSLGEKLFFSEGAIPDVIVPDIINKPLPEAYSILKASGLNIEISGIEYSSAIPSGNVISQDPASGLKVKAGRSIKVVVSKGIEFVNVPNVVGQDLGNARKILESVGLKIGDIRETPSRTTPDGIVISQNPKYGSITSKNSLVAIEIARHLQSSMPNLIGKTQEEAERILKSLGSYILIIKEKESDTPGIVIEQNPVANTTLIQETPRIEITVGIPKKVIPQSTPFPTPEESPIQGGTETPSNTEVLPPE
ncbi:MAG: PASTA domain-containing protein [bacterium]